MRGSAVRVTGASMFARSYAYTLPAGVAGMRAVTRPGRAGLVRSTSSLTRDSVPFTPRPPATRILDPRLTAARSERGVERRPPPPIRPERRSTATTRAVGVPAAAPRPPTTYATSPIAAAAACVVGAGRQPILATPPRGTYWRIARLAVPFASEPPAITSRFPTAVTAA